MRVGQELSVQVDQGFCMPLDQRVHAGGLGLSMRVGQVLSNSIQVDQGLSVHTSRPECLCKPTKVVSCDFKWTRVVRTSGPGLAMFVDQVVHSS